MCLYVRAGAQGPHTRACDINVAEDAMIGYRFHSLLLFIIAYILACVHGLVTIKLSGMEKMFLSQK